MAYIGNQPTSVAFLTDQFSGNGSTTAFTLSAAPANTNSILVAISGVLQDPSTYSISGTTLTFSPAPPTGTGNISVRFLGIPASGVTTTAYRTVTEFTATAGQTTFTPPSYTVGYINVFRNGALLGTADYTASNGTTVVLANPASLSDLVVVESFYVSSVLNAIPATNGAVTSAYLLDGAVTQAKLAAGVAGNGPAFSAYNTSNQSVTDSTYTKVTLGTEEFDTNNNFASGTFTPTVAGYYQINGSIYTGTSAITRAIAYLYKNGTGFKRGTDRTVGNSVNVCAIVYLNGSTDYVELFGYVTATTPLFYGTDTWFNGCLIRTA